MTLTSRREFIGALAGALPALRGLASVAGHGHQFRIRTITAGVQLDSPAELRPVESAMAFLGRARRAFQDAGYDVQTIRFATQPFAAPTERLLADLAALDRVARDHDAMASIGPLARGRSDEELAAWAAELIRTTRVINCSVAVSTPSEGVDPGAARAAAATVAAIARATPGGEGNFRFAAAASCPAGIPFFPAAYHTGDSDFGVGLESAPLVATAFAGAGAGTEARTRLRRILETELGAVQAVAVALARREGRRYLGIDASPAPGKDASIGAAIEALTRVPFGDASTLEACATITDVLKRLAVRTCGYSGLMLPVLEDPVLARRAAERRFSVKELLLYSSVCGTGLDVVPLPGDTPVDVLASLIRDVATLAVKLSKPLSARLFPIPGKAAGEAVRFTNPYLTDSVVMAIP